MEREISQCHLYTSLRNHCMISLNFTEMLKGDADWEEENRLPLMDMDGVEQWTRVSCQKLKRV